MSEKGVLSSCLRPSRASLGSFALNSISTIPSYLMSSINGPNENEQAPTTPQLCMEIVQDYEKGAYSKVLAIKNIIEAFTKSDAYQNISPDETDTAVETYLAMLDQHSSSRTIAATQGTHISFTHDLSDKEEEYDNRSSFSGSKRGRAESQGTKKSSKKRTPDESLYAWKTEDDDEAVLTPSQELTRKMVLNQTIDIKSTKLVVLTSRRVPEFPDSEWNNVLSGRAVNLDTVFSGMFSTITDNRAVENIGELELHFGASKPSKAVKTHGDWVVF